MKYSIDKVHPKCVWRLKMKWVSEINSDYCIKSSSRKVDSLVILVELIIF